ncbi:hypothetical protein [Paraclostridium bifermentans]|uniref:hypothetical protein n=1 Tax=Paraclostridium bifermentans TaxID=1490 RepID=UPI00374F8F8F
MVGIPSGSKFTSKSKTRQPRQSSRSQEDLEQTRVQKRPSRQGNPRPKNNPKQHNVNTKVKPKKQKQRPVKEHKSKGLFGLNKHKHDYEPIEENLEPKVLEKVPGYLRNENLDTTVKQDNSYLLTLKSSMRKGCVAGVVCLEIPSEILGKIDDSISYALDEREFGEADFIEKIDDEVEESMTTQHNNNTRERFKFI